MTFVRLSLSFIVCAVLLGPMAYGQNIEADVQQLADNVNQARAANLHLSAPSAFRDASESLGDAQKKIKKGDKLSEIQSAVQRGQRRLAEGQQLTDIGEVILKDAFAARNAALEARAPEFSKEQWKDGEKTMRSAGSEIENGDQNDAREDAQEAHANYRKAELNAIEANLLGAARTERSAAKEAGAKKWARQTWTAADDNLRQAEQILRTNRSERDASRTLAKQATEQFKHARLLAGMAKRIDDDVKKNAEKTLLQYEANMRRVAETLGMTANFGDGADTVTERLVASVQSQKDDRVNLQETLREREDQIDRLQQVVDSLDGRLASLEEREGNVSAQLRTQRERDRMLKRVRGIFQPEEAKVLTSGDALIVRMKGLNFASGSSEIQPKNFGLLTKLQRVIREFPDGSITISGHTDARGNDAMNMKLSEQRSQAVHQYLMANMDLRSDQIRAVGRGESEPIATNETEDGRLQNRRIDVMIGFQE